MKKVYIADIKSTNNKGKSEGHYFAVAQNYADVLSSDACVYVAGGPVYRERFKNHFSLPFDSKSSNSKLINKINTFLNAVFLLKMVRSRDSVVVFQCSAVSTVCMALALVKPRCDVFLIQYDTYMRNSRLKSILFDFVSKRINGIVCPGREIGEAMGVKYCISPDYVYCENSVSIEVAELKYDFGMYGILAEGKGIFEVAEILANTKCKVKIAGKVGSLPEDQAMLSKLQTLCEHAHNIELENGYLSDEKFDSYIRSTKYIILNYNDSYALRSSGIILDSIYRNTPVIVRNRKYAEFVHAENIGLVYDNFADVDIDLLLDPKTRFQYVNNIKKFLDNQDKRRKNLIYFILGR